MSALVIDFFERNIHAQQVYQVGDSLFHDGGSAESANKGVPYRHLRKDYQPDIDAKARKNGKGENLDLETKKELQATKDDLKSEIESLSGDIANLQAGKDGLQSKRDSLANEITELQAEINAFEAELAALKETATTQKQAKK